MKRLSSNSSDSSSTPLITICPTPEEQSTRNCQQHVYGREFQSMMLEGLDEEGCVEEVGHQSEKKRRLSVDQVKALEKNFEVENKLEPERKVKLAQELGLQPRQVAVWFQNRRARWKTKQLERDYGVLKANFDALKLNYDTLNHDNEALRKQIKELKLRLEEGVSVKEEIMMPDSEDKTTMEQSKSEPSWESEEQLNYECFNNNDCFGRLYTITPVAAFFAPNSDGVSLGPLMALLQDKIFLQSWSELKDATREGGVPFNRVYGTHAFEYPRLDSRFNKVFNTAMINHTTLVMKEVLESYRGFEGIKRVVDVGGGLGVNINLITSKYPHIHGVNFDLPHVIQEAPSYPGVEHVGGDMFENVPKGDALFMKWILHDWSDEHCVKLLKNCYDAIPDDGKVIVVEAILPKITETNNAYKAISQIDVLMMTQNPGGKERSEEEFMKLAREAGFSGIRYECHVNIFWIMEFFK